MKSSIGQNRMNTSELDILNTPPPPSGNNARPSMNSPPRTSANDIRVNTPPNWVILKIDATNRTLSHILEHVDHIYTYVWICSVIYIISSTYALVWGK